MTRQDKNKAMKETWSYYPGSQNQAQNHHPQYIVSSDKDDVQQNR